MGRSKRVSLSTPTRPGKLASGGVEKKQKKTNTKSAATSKSKADARGKRSKPTASSKKAKASAKARSSSKPQKQKRRQAGKSANESEHVSSPSQVTPKKRGSKGARQSEDAAREVTFRKQRTAKWKPISKATKDAALHIMDVCFRQALTTVRQTSVVTDAVEHYDLIRDTVEQQLEKLRAPKQPQRGSHARLAASFDESENQLLDLTRELDALRDRVDTRQELVEAEEVHLTRFRQRMKEVQKRHETLHTNKLHPILQGSGSNNIHTVMETPHLTRYVDAATKAAAALDPSTHPASFRKTLVKLSQRLQSMQEDLEPLSLFLTSVHTLTMHLEQ